MTDLIDRLREAHPRSTQYALGSMILSEAADEIEQLRAERDALRGANDSLVRWKGEIDQRRILLRLPFPDDYDNSPKYAINTLIDAEIDVANDN